MDSDFDILAAKVLAREASPEEQARLERLLTESPALRSEFADLKIVWDSLKTAGPAAFALDAEPARIPEHRLNRLQVEVQKHQAAAGQPKTSTQPLHPSTAPGETLWSGLHRWWRTGNLVWARLVAGLAAAVAVIVVGLWLARAPESPPRSSIEEQPAAYLVIQQGTATIVRDGQTRPAPKVAVLRTSEELELPPGASVSLLRPGVISQLNGPLRARIDNLTRVQQSPQAVASHEALNTALFTPARELSTAGLLATVRSSQGLVIYSPAGATAHLRPTLLWQNQPGKTYDVTISDEFNAQTPAWRAATVTSPLEFSKIQEGQVRALSPSGLYRIRISETGNLLSATEKTFQVLGPEAEPKATADSEKLLVAHRILAAQPARLGDALAELLTLPPELAASPLALRLKLLAFGRLGSEPDFSATLAQLQASP